MGYSVKARLIAPFAFAFALALLAFSLAMPPAAYAASIGFTQESFTFINADDDGAWFFTKDDSVDIASAVSSNEKVATVRTFSTGILVVDPVGEGTAFITVTGTDSSTTKIKVVVSKNYFPNCLKNVSNVWYCWYGNKKLEVSSQPGAKCTLKIGKEKHSLKIGKKGYATVKLKKVYKLGTKITCEFTHGKYSVKLKEKVFSATGFDGVSASKKTVRVDCYELHKGDVVKLTYKGKTYTKKVKKGKSYSTVKFSLKSKVKKNSKMKIVIKNKFKQKLCSEKIKLDGWHYTVKDGEEDEGDLEAA